MNKFNKIFNKQALIVPLDKVIGQAKRLFNYGINYILPKKSVEIIPDGLLGISINNGMISLAHLIVNSLEDITVKSFGLFTIELANLNNSEDPKSVQNIIAKYIKDHELNNIECCYVLSNTQYVLSLIEAVDNDNKARDKAILLGVKDYINYSIDDAILESFAIPVVRTRDNVKLAYAVAMRAKISEDIGILIKASGAYLKYIDINELCLINIISLYNITKDGCLLLKLSEETSSILLVKDNALLISRNAKLDIKQLNNFDPAINIADDQFNVAENLILELQRSLDYGNSIFKEIHFSSVIILPCEANLDLFTTWGQEQLGLPINKIDLNNKLKFSINMTQFEQATCLIAIGAALRKIGMFL